MSYQNEYKVFTKLFILSAGLLLLVSGYSYWKIKQETKLTQKTHPINFELIKNLTNVDEITLSIQTKHLTFYHNNQIWELYNKYPVSMNKVVNLLLALSDLTVIKEQVVDELGLTKAGLIDDNDESIDNQIDSRDPIRITLKNKAENIVYLDLIIGKELPDSNQVLAKIPNTNIVTLIEGYIPISVDIKDWIMQPFSLLTANDIQEIVLTNEQSNTFKFVRENTNTAFKLTDPNDIILRNIYSKINLQDVLDEILAVDCEDVFSRPTLLPANKLLMQLGLPTRGILKLNDSPVIKIKLKNFQGEDLLVELLQFKQGLFANFAYNHQIMIPKQAPLTHTALDKKLTNYYFKLNSHNLNNMALAAFGGSSSHDGFNGSEVTVTN